jgi:hypothetical protein
LIGHRAILYEDDCVTTSLFLANHCVFGLARISSCIMVRWRRGTKPSANGSETTLLLLVASRDGVLPSKAAPAQIGRRHATNNRNGRDHVRKWSEALVHIDSKRTKSFYGVGSSVLSRDSREVDLRGWRLHLRQPRGA